MNYEEMSLDDLKEIAKKYNINIGNYNKTKLIDKIIKYEAQLNASKLLQSDIKEDIDQNSNIETKTNIIKNSSTKNNLINELNNIVSDLEDFEENDIKDESIEDIGMEEEVACMSIVFGGLTYISTITGAKYKWHKIGDVEYLSMKELVSMNNSKPIFLNKPWIILQDIRAVNKFRLISKYEQVAKVNSLKQLFLTNNLKYIGETIDMAVKFGMRDVIIAKVRAMYTNGVLNNINIINLLENRLKFDLSINKE